MIESWWVGVGGNGLGECGCGLGESVWMEMGTIELGDWVWVDMGGNG